MKLIKENAFLDAEVKYRDKTYYIIKINEKTVYLSTDKDFSKKERPKGYTWKKWCDRVGAVMIKFSDGIYIDEVEIAKGNNFIVRKKTAKRYLTQFEEKEMLERYKLFIEDKGGYSAFFENAGGKKIHPITFNKNGQMLIRKEEKYFFYDVELNTYTFFKNLGDGKKELVWPRNEAIEEKKAG